jgi:hypothetical protein
MGTGGSSPVVRRLPQVIETLSPFFRFLPAPLIIFAVNAWVVWRLFFVKYLDQLPSVEGEFIAMARYIQQHGPGYDWQSLWLGGFPVVRTYQPLVHYTVATFASLSNLEPASAFHFLGALSYSLGGIAMYCLAKALSRSQVTGLLAGLSFSLFSPSSVLLSGIRHDAGGAWNARRLQALVVYGELPNLTGLMLGMFALAVLHLALTRRTPKTALAAAVLIAAVPATNWPSTVAISIGILCYLAALSWSEIRDCLPRVAVIGLMATAFTLPFALPSTIFSTYGNANVMAQIPTHDPQRWLFESLLVVCFFVARFVLIRFRASFGFRFAVLWLIVLGWVVFSSTLAGVAILPLPLRFHIAFEIPLTMASAFLISQLCSRRPEIRAYAAAVFALFCFVQLFHYRQHAGAMIHSLDITRTLEYEEATWFDANMRGERVLAPGTIQFWMNVFTSTPQMAGCCDQSVLNREDSIAAYVTAAGYQTDAESADYSILWMKAFAVHAVSIGGERSREWYKQFKFPNRYRGRLDEAWSNGDDFIYRVPARVPGLARIVRRNDLIRHAPTNGIDAAELRPFVAALDDPSLPAAGWQWRNDNQATIKATMEPDQVIAVALNYHPGWNASLGGKPVAVHSDGLGFVVIEPHCSGSCVIEMRWSAGVEPWLAISASLLTLAGALFWWARTAKRQAATDLVSRG